MSVFPSFNQDFFKGLTFDYKPPVAAMVSLVPTFYGFVAKSARQRGKPFPKMTVIQSLKGGFKAAPVLGGAIGIQVNLQTIVERLLVGSSEKPTFKQLVFSTAIVGAISAPPLALFNARTMGLNWKEAFRSFRNIKVISVIAARETSFLGAIAMSKPVCKKMKQIFGDRKVVEIGSYFTSGVIGSVCGHLADTALTIWQDKKTITEFSLLKRGLVTRALTIGVFNTFFQISKSWLSLYSDMRIEK